jgi:hypothetical protein
MRAVTPKRREEKPGASRACFISKAPEPLLTIAFDALRDHARGHPDPAGHVGKGGTIGP